MSIDQVLSSIYTRNKYSELGAIAKMVDGRVIREIQNELSAGFANRTGYKQRLYIDHDWIDKIPLANFLGPVTDMNGNPILQKVEVGDIFIRFRRRSPYYSAGAVRINQIDDRAIVIQAKLSSTSCPKVPIASFPKHKVSSTSKELYLLENWSPFDLYETSRSRTPLSTNIRVSMPDPGRSFYGGFHNQTKAWNFGKANFGQTCNISYGDLLKDLKSGKIGQKVDGADPSWKSIADQVDRIAGSRVLPRSICPNPRPRKTVARATLYSFPAIDIESILESFRRKKFLVVTIDQLDFEGHDLENLMK